MKTVKIAAFGISSLLLPCLAFAVAAPTGEMLERVDATLLGDGQIAGTEVKSAPATRGWSVQVGAFSDQDSANARLVRISEIAPAGLSRASLLVTPIEWGKGRMLYRARFGSLDRETAQKICVTLSRRGETCFVAEDETASSADLKEVTVAPALREALDMPTKEEISVILASAPQINDSDLQEMRGGLRSAGTTPATSRTTPVTLARLASAEQVGNDELQNMRGGYFTAAGAHFDFGASVQTMVNGQLALQSSVNWTPAGAVTQQLAGLGTSIQNQVNANLAKAGIGSVGTSATDAAALAGNTAAVAAANALAAAGGGATSSAAISAPTVQSGVQPGTNTSPQVPGLSGVQIQSPTGGSTQVLANLGGNSIQNIILNSASNQNILQNTNVTLTIYNFPAWQQQLTQNAVSSQLAHDIMAAAGLH